MGFGLLRMGEALGVKIWVSGVRSRRFEKCSGQRFFGESNFCVQVCNERGLSILDEVRPPLFPRFCKVRLFGLCRIFLQCSFLGLGRELAAGGRS